MSSINPVGKMGILELSQSGIDSNSNTTTNSLEISDYKDIVFSVDAATGSHGTHVVTLQCSLDDSSWVDTTNTLTGTGVKGNSQIIAKFIRLKVTTVEGGTSTIDIIIQAK